MESRKIQKVGAATLTISLPKAWVSQRGLKKGDQVFLVEEGKALKVLPSDATQERRSMASDYIIDSDLCDEPGMLERVIVGNYVLGRERIIVRSSLRLRSEHQDEIRRSVRRLIGMGILEESSAKVVLQCSINPANYPLDTLVKRLYNLGSTMLSEALEALATKDGSLADDAIKREDDADMMYWLILRLVLSAQMDEALVEQLGMRTRLEIPGNRAIARDLEAVADHACDIANYVKQILDADIKVPSSVLKAFKSLQDIIEQTYGHALGTARMGSDGDPGAVVDQYCRVRGVENLWVVDASVMPTVPRAVPNLTVIMLGERVAEWLRRSDPAMNQKPLRH